MVKAYARVTMLTKLKYAGVNTEDLVNIYILFILSALEYCSVLWHSTITGDQAQSIEREPASKSYLGQNTKAMQIADDLDYFGLQPFSERPTVWT